MRQILALSGGGYRGLFSAKVLETLGSGLDEPLHSKFDLIAGTSIGGILAIGLAVGVAPAALYQAIEEHGPSIFDKSVRVPCTKIRFPLPRLGIATGRYSADNLRAAIIAILGEKAGMMLSKVTAPLLVVAVNRTTAKPMIFTSPVIGKSAELDVTLLDLALATSAAPTYFPEHAIGNRNMIDGGVIANAPDLLALMEVMLSYGSRADEIRMLSVGTAGGDLADRYREPGNYGAIQWLGPALIGGRKLFDVTIAAQESMAIDLAQRLLGDRFVRIDRAPNAQQQAKVALDKTGKDATNNLALLASQALEDLTPREKQILGEILRHKI